MREVELTSLESVSQRLEQVVGCWPHALLGDLDESLQRDAVEVREVVARE